MTKNRKMSTEKYKLFTASNILKLIFYVGTCTVLIMMLLLQNETNLDIIAIRSYVEEKNTSRPLYRLKSSSFSVSNIEFTRNHQRYPITIIKSKMFAILCFNTISNLCVTC